MGRIYTSLGTMSGTSFDGIDLSIIETDGKNHLVLKKDLYCPYSYQIKSQLKKFKKKLSSKNYKDMLKSKSFLELSRVITLLHAKAATKLIKIYKKKIDVVGFHGVTVLHDPKKKITIQLGDPSLLRQLLQTSVIFNFRQNDLNNGGQGAPLIPIYHKAISAKIKEKKPCLFINIGGISNFTYINNRKMFATDIGPGNCLLDEWMLLNSGKDFDKDGKTSAKGTINFNLIANFLDRFDYFHKKNTSYDTGDFNISELRGLSLEDGAATLSYLSAILIADTIKKYNNIDNVYFGGGGRKNLFIMKVIKKNTNVNIINLDKKKINGDFVESQAFAYLAVRSLLKLPISFKETTGVKKNVSGGEIYKN